MLNRRRFCTGLAVAPLLATRGGSAFAQDGKRPFTLVVPYTPGGSADTLGRIFADAMSIQVNERVLVDNRPGAGGTIGAAYVAAAPADGRTLLYTLGNLLMNQEFMLKDVRFRANDSLVPIARTTILQVAIVTSATSPFNDLREFLALAKREPGKRSFAYYGDLGVLSMASEAGVDLIRVPYKGGTPGLVDVLAGRVDIIASSLTQAQPMLKAGKAKIALQMGMTRDPAYPDVPTAIEIMPTTEGKQLFEIAFAEQVMGRPFVMPPGVPEDRVKVLRDAFDAALKDPEVLKEAASQKMEIDPVSGAEINALLDRVYAAPPELAARLSAMAK